MMTRGRLGGMAGKEENKNKIPQVPMCKFSRVLTGKGKPDKTQ